MISNFVISEEEIRNIIRPFNPTKAHGWDEISIRMIKLSDACLVTPLKMIFINCLRQGVLPESWKCAVAKLDENRWSCPSLTFKH